MQHKLNAVAGCFERHSVLIPVSTDLSQHGIDGIGIRTAETDTHGTINPAAHINRQLVTLAAVCAAKSHFQRFGSLTL